MSPRPEFSCSVVRKLSQGSESPGSTNVRCNSASHDRQRIPGRPWAGRLAPQDSVRCAVRSADSQCSSAERTTLRCPSEQHERRSHPRPSGRRRNGKRGRRGIGRVVAETFAHAGIQVFIAARTKLRVDATAGRNPARERSRTRGGHRCHRPGGPVSHALWPRLTVCSAGQPSSSTTRASGAHVRPVLEVMLRLGGETSR